MAKSAAARKLDEVESPLPSKRLGFSDGPPPVRPNIAILNNARLAVIMLLAAELMFFAGLIGAFLVYRLSATVWPPPFQPRLPLGVTGVNSLILILSALTMHWAVGAGRDGAANLLRQLTFTALLGALFLLIQGYEWVRLVHFGLTTSSSIYGGIFYTLIGAHGVHVFGGLIWLSVVCWQAKHGRYTKQNFVGVQTARMYWTFVVALWPLLYGLVYLY